MNKSGIKLIDSGESGPTLAIFAGVHGNERAGVYALQQLVKTLQVSRGKLYLVLANQPAIEKNIRFETKNLNRCFIKDNKGKTQEDKRAVELMKVLDKCDALLDLHMFYDDDGVPFAICEPNSFDVAKIFDVEIISSNWTKTEPGGTDGYMFEQGKIGVCLECGPISKSKEMTGYAIDAVYRFLSYFEMTDKPVKFSKEPKRHVKSMSAVNKTSATFDLKKGYKNFQQLALNELIATDGEQEFTAGQDEVIIFPHYNAKIDEEAYIIGKDMEKI